MRGNITRDSGVKINFGAISNAIFSVGRCGQRSAIQNEAWPMRLATASTSAADSAASRPSPAKRGAKGADGHLREAVKSRRRADDARIDADRLGQRSGRGDADADREDEHRRDDQRDAQMSRKHGAEQDEGRENAERVGADQQTRRAQSLTMRRLVSMVPSQTPETRMAR